MTNPQTQQNIENLLHAFEQLEQIPMSQTWKNQLTNKIAFSKQQQSFKVKTINIALLVLVLLNIVLIYRSFASDKHQRQQDLSLISSEFLSYSSNANNR